MMILDLSHYSYTTVYRRFYNLGIWDFIHKTVRILGKMPLSVIEADVNFNESKTNKNPRQ